MAYTCNARLVGGQDGKIVLEVVDDTTGVINSVVGSLEIAVADLLGKRITARETIGCNEAGDPQYCVMLRSPWYSSPVGSDFT